MCLPEQAVGCPSLGWDSPWKMIKPTCANFIAHCFVMLTPSLGENDKTEGYIVTPRTKELLRQHQLETGGKVSDICAIMYSCHVTGLRSFR